MMMTSRLTCSLINCMMRHTHLMRSQRMSGHNNDEMGSGKGRVGEPRAHHLQLTSHQQRQSQQPLEAEIVSIRELSPTVKAFSLKLMKDEESLTFRAGQWLDMFVPNVSEVAGYSMTSSPSTFTREKSFELAVKSTNFVPTKWMTDEAKEGLRVHVRFGGDFHYPNEFTSSFQGNHNLLLLAGGVGINPLMSIMRHVNDVYNDVRDESFRPLRTHLMYSSRNEKELIFQEDIDNLCQLHPKHFSVDYFITQNSSEVAKSHKRGRMAIEDVKKTLNMLREENGLKVFSYLCGPQSFLKDCRENLRELGVDDNQVFHESWW